MTKEVQKKYNALQNDFEKRISSGKLGNLSLFDFKTVADIGKELLRRHTAKTLVKNVADYYKSFGFMVTKDFDGINFVIVEI